MDGLAAARMIYDAKDPTEAERLFAAYSRTAHYPISPCLPFIAGTIPPEANGQTKSTTEVLEFGCWAARGEPPQ